MHSWEVREFYRAVSSSGDSRESEDLTTLRECVRELIRDGKWISATIQHKLARGMPVEPEFERSVCGGAWTPTSSPPDVLENVGDVVSYRRTK